MPSDRLNMGWTHEGSRGSETRAFHRQPDDLDRQVMDHLRASNGPQGAYEIVRLSRRTGMPLAPSQVYRVLARLADRGAVQRIELLSAYTPAERKYAGFLVCKYCRSVESFDGTSLVRLIEPLCVAEGFAPGVPVIEILGRCRECAGQAPTSPPEKPLVGKKILLALLSMTGSAVLAAPADAAAPMFAEAACKQAGSSAFRWRNTPIPHHQSGTKERLT